MLFCVLGRKDPVAAVIMTSGPLPNILRIRLTIEFNTLSWLGRADADNQVKPIESNEWSKDKEEEVGWDAMKTNTDFL